MMRLQRCADCGAVQYPSREFCGCCLSDRLEWEAADFLSGRVLACTTLQHSNEPAFRSRLPLNVALVLLDAGPVVVCFVTRATVGGAVRVAAGADELLVAVAITP